MKVGVAMCALLAAVPFLGGCKGFWQKPGNSGGGGSGCTTNCTTLSSGNFYILNNGSTPQVVGEAIVSGKLTAISGSPWNLLAPAFAIAMAPSGNFLYVSTTSGVYMYPISGGSLRPSGAVAVSSDLGALALAVDTSGKWLVEAVQAGTGSVTMAAVPLNTSSGGNNGAEATSVFPVTNAAVQNDEMAFTPDDTRVLVALGSGGTIAIPFNAGVNPGNNPFGGTAPVVPVAKSGGSALSVAVDPAGKLFYVGETLADPTGKTGGLRVFTLASLGSTLVQATGSPIASGGLAPNSILPAATGTEVYVANGAGTGSAGNIASFLVSSSGSTYTIAAGSTVAAGTQPFSLAEDNKGNFILAINQLGSPYFSSYTFDTTTTGQLDLQITANTGASPQAVVAAP